MPGASAVVPSSKRHCRDPVEATTSAMLRNSTAPPITSAEYDQELESQSEFGRVRLLLTINDIAAAATPNEKENSTMTAEPTGVFQGLAPLLVNRMVIMTVAADGKGFLTLNVIPKKVKDDESDALTTALCITASAEELDRDLAAQLREFTDVHAKAATNIQKVKEELAAAEKAEREAADERRAKKTKGKAVPPAAARTRKAAPDTFAWTPCIKANTTASRGCITSTRSTR